METAQRPVLEISGLRKRYGPVCALHDLDLRIGAGEIVGLLGPNGAGKTSTIECIAGLLEPDGGAILLGGASLDRTARGKIGLALQATALQDKITPAEALRLFATLYGVPPRVDALLAGFGLADLGKRRYDRLSGGEKQRLALALAFVNAPHLVLLDEPTAGLDVASRHGLHDLIRDRAADGCAILLTTHDLAEAERLCDRLVILDRGRVVAQGQPKALVGGASAGTMVAGETDRPLDPGAFEGPGALSVDGSAFHCRTDDPNRALASLLALADRQGCNILALHMGPPSLEDIILTLTNSAATP